MFISDSATSSNSDTDISCLHAGVCLSQTSVDTIDSSIAVKAFEVMILCLCARPELIGRAGYLTANLSCLVDSIASLPALSCLLDCNIVYAIYLQSSSFTPQWSYEAKL